MDMQNCRVFFLTCLAGQTFLACATCVTFNKTSKAHSIFFLELNLFCMLLCCHLVAGFHEVVSFAEDAWLCERHS